MYKLGQHTALESLGLKRKGEGFFRIKDPGTGAVMGTAIGTSAATSVYGISRILGKDLQQITGYTLPQLVAMSGVLGAGLGALYGSTLEK